MPMRILHVISGIDPRGGGTTTAVAGLAEAQAAVGLDVSILATHKERFESTVADRLRGLGLPVTLIGPCRTPLMMHPEISPALKRLIPQVDLVHIHSLWEEVQHRAAVVARRLDVPYVITPHGMLDPWSLAQSPMRKRLYMAWRLRRNLNGAARLHFMSEFERRETAKLGVGTAALIEPLGVDMTEYEHLPSHGAFRNKYPGIGDRPLIVFLGRIYPGKGLEYLVPAMADVTPPDAVLAIVGPNSSNYQQHVQDRVALHSLQDRVVFTGMLQGPEKVAALADADLFCLPSDHENFGVVVIEALAAGTPAILSEHVAICDEVVAAGVGASTQRDPAALAAELSSWLADRARLDQAAGRARLFVREHYSWKSIANHWVEHYRQIAAEREPIVGSAPRGSM